MIPMFPRGRVIPLPKKTSSAVYVHVETKHALTRLQQLAQSAINLKFVHKKKMVSFEIYMYEAV